MATRSSQLSSLVNPEPVLYDPEDDEEILAGLKAKLTTHDPQDSDDDDDVEDFRSQLRTENVSLLAEEDDRYAGRVISRHDIDYCEETLDDSRNERDDRSNEGDGSSGEEDQQTDMSSEGDASHDDSVDDSVDEQSRNDDHSLSIKEATEPNLAVKTNESTTENSGIATFSRMADDDGDEMTRGKAVLAQLALWDSLLEIRIRIQKVLSLVNRLPQPDVWPSFRKNGGQQFTTSVSQCERSVGGMMRTLVHLQSAVLGKDDSSMAASSSSTEKRGNIDDDEITSDDDDDVRSHGREDVPISASKRPMKRKLDTDYDLSELLAKRHSTYEQHRNKVIEKWSEKTRLASGRFNSKAFSALHQSAVQQIKQILADRSRLILRTQVKRSSYKILGKSETGDTEDDNPEDSSDLTLKPRDTLREVDPEIFDDDDFYHQLLRELIQQKCADISDPSLLSRHLIQIQRLRNKTKRNVDTSASKGRKLRYNVHQKMVSFMAPVDDSVWTDDSKDDLFKSLFGKGSDVREDAPLAETIRII